MARDDDPWRRLREREEEEERAREAERLGRKGSSGPKSGPATRGGAAPGSSAFEQELHQASLLIEQVGNLYNMFIAGVERLPPVEKRKMLEKLMAELMAEPKPTQAMQFRFNSVNANYLTNRDRWDRLMKDLETGKIKRRTSGK